MSAPSALTVVYPPSFQNSFWSYPSYRRGAQSLYSRLQAGIDENESILAFVAHRAELEYTHAEALATPAPAPSFSAPLFKNAGGLLQDVLSSATSPTSPFVDGPGFGSPNARGFAHNETGASRAFRLIQAETTNAQATAHGKVARSLEGLILNPFGKWAQDHKERITNSWEHVDAALTRFERQKAEVEKLKHNYESKCRQADEAEDDARFAPVEDHLPEPSTPKRSVSAGSGPTALSPEEKPSKPADPETLKRRETIRKQFGFGDRSASASLPKPAKEFAGVKLPTPPAETDDDSPIMKDQSHNSPGATGLKRSGTIGAYLSSAVERIPAPIKAAVGGVVSNEPRHIRLRRDADNAERVYEEAVRNLDRTRCQVEEILYEHYGLTQRWEADRIRAVKSVLVSYNQSLSAIVPGFDRSLARGLQIQDAVNPDLELRALIREARTGPFHPAIERFQPYYHDEISLGRGPAGHSEAVAWMTKNGGFGPDLALVERLDYLEKLEKGADGASASATATHKLGVLPPVLDALLNALERAYKDNDRWPKAPPAVPAKEGEESSDASDSSLLRLSQEKRKAWIYEVPLSVTHRLRDALIAQLSPSHADMIYGSQAPGGDGSKLISDKMLDAYDPPVLAACIKVWLLELDKSLILEDLWDQIDAIYRAAAGQEREALEALRKKQAETKTDADVDAATGEDAEKEETKDEAKDKATTDTGKAAEGPKKIDLATEERIRKGVLEDLGVVLNKLPKIHLASLDAIISHLHRLVKETKTDESDLIYLNKLGLAFGRGKIPSGSILMMLALTLTLADSQLSSVRTVRRRSRWRRATQPWWSWILSNTTNRSSPPFWSRRRRAAEATAASRLTGSARRRSANVPSR